MPTGKLKLDAYICLYIPAYPSIPQFNGLTTCLYLPKFMNLLVSSVYPTTYLRVGLINLSSVGLPTG